MSTACQPGTVWVGRDRSSRPPALLRAVTTSTIYYEEMRVFRASGARAGRRSPAPHTLTIDRRDFERDFRPATEDELAAEPPEPTWLRPVAASVRRAMAQVLADASSGDATPGLDELAAVSMILAETAYSALPLGRAREHYDQVSGLQRSFAEGKYAEVVRAVERLQSERERSARGAAAGRATR